MLIRHHERVHRRPKFENAKLQPFAVVTQYYQLYNQRAEENWRVTKLFFGSLLRTIFFSFLQSQKTQTDLNLCESLVRKCAVWKSPWLGLVLHVEYYFMSNRVRYCDQIRMSITGFRGWCKPWRKSLRKKKTDKNRRWLGQKIWWMNKK